MKIENSGPLWGFGSPLGLRVPSGAGAKETVDRHEEKPPSLREVARRAGGRGGTTSVFLMVHCPLSGARFFLCCHQPRATVANAPFALGYGPLPLSGRAVWDSNGLRQKEPVRGPYGVKFDQWEDQRRVEYQRNIGFPHSEFSIFNFCPRCPWASGDPYFQFSITPSAVRSSLRLPER